MASTMYTFLLIIDIILLIYPHTTVGVCSFNGCPNECCSWATQIEVFNDSQINNPFNQECGKTCTRQPTSCATCGYQVIQCRDDYHYFPCSIAAGYDCYHYCCSNWRGYGYNNPGALHCCSSANICESTILYGTECKNTLHGTLTNNHTFEHYKIDILNLTGYQEGGTIYIDKCSTNDLIIDIYLFREENEAYYILNDDDNAFRNTSDCKYEWVPYLDDENDTFPGLNFISIYSRYGNKTGEYIVEVSCTDKSQDTSQEKGESFMEGIVAIIIVGVICIVGTVIFIHCYCKRKRNAQSITHEKVPQHDQVNEMVNTGDKTD